MLSPALLKIVTERQKRHTELTTLLSDPAILGDPERYRALSKECAPLSPIVGLFGSYERLLQSKAGTEALGEDPEMQALAAEELPRLEQEIAEVEQELSTLLLPKDPDDGRNVFIEIRGGTGGHEAALFAGDLFRMYAKYAEKRGWTFEVIHSSLGEYGGYKEITTRVLGKGVYGSLKFESGVHRVQRVPETEAQGRIHTSTCTVAILPEVEDIDHIDIRPEDLKIDTFRASGAGGQHVNRTESAVRITHLPTGFIVECQDERSQHQNRARALSVLQSRLLASEREKQRVLQAQTRKSLVGSADRSERIRTYNFPQNRVTDHRVHVTLYELTSVLAGDLECLIQPLAAAERETFLGE